MFKISGTAAVAAALLLTIQATTELLRNTPQRNSPVTATSAVFLFRSSLLLAAFAFLRAARLVVLLDLELT